MHKVISALQYLYRKLVSDQAITGTSSSIYAGGNIARCDQRETAQYHRGGGNLQSPNNLEQRIRRSGDGESLQERWYAMGRNIGIESGSSPASGTSACFWHC